MKRLISVILAFIIAFASLGICDTARLNVVADDNVAPQINPGVWNYAFPDNMKATEITIGYDFFKDIYQGAEKTAQEVEQIMSNLESYGLNTIIINTSYNGIVYYETDAKVFKNGSPLDMLIQEAREHNFFVYITFDLNEAINSKSITELKNKIDYLSACAHKLTNKYLIDGIILNDYYASKNDTTYENYYEYGSGIGFENWLKDNSGYVFRLVSNAIRSTSNTVAVGIAIENAWLNIATDPSGSDTKDDFEALTDGFSDTKAYLENGYADFMIVTCYGGLESKELSFVSTVSWWNNLAVSANIPMFISHANERISTSDSSWAADQILKQLEECAKYSSYQGSVFRSYESLKENKGTSTDALVKYFKGLIDTNSLYTELSMVLPKKYNYTTYEPTVKFQGSFDSNFDIYFNGEKITLNEAGNFYFEEDLEVGTNTFTFKNKAKTITYKITRKVDVLQSVEPEAGVVTRLEGRTKLAISAIAYSGSIVTATLNGKTIQLNEEDASDEIDANSSYAKFTGYFTVPEGKIGEEQDLGEIVINGNYKNLCYESAQSTRVIVNAIDPATVEAKIAIIKEDNTITYDYYTTDNVAIPTSPRLPAGTVDVITKEVTYNVSANGVNQTLKYYLTESGLRIKASDCTVVDSYNIVNNFATLKDALIDNGDTVLRFELGYQTPFKISYSPITYEDPENQSYLVDTFNPEYVLVTFDYVTEYEGAAQFNSNSLFSSAEWREVVENGEKKAQLRLKLRKSGIFSGYTASYDSDGILSLRFSRYNSSLYGAVIVVDPGHGYNEKANVFDPGAVGHVLEQTINMGISQKLVAALRAQGATVYILPTDTTQISVYDRSSYARRYNPDMFISVHCNSTTKGEGVRGVEAFYFTPFSQPLAKLVSQKMADYYKYNVYGDGKNRDRGAKYNYFAVTLEQEFPSILIESGFVTDYAEAMALNNPTVQQGLANAITQAVVEFFNRK